MAAILDSAAHTIRVESNLWFPIELHPFASSQDGSGGFSILSLIRPRITVYDSSGNVVISEAPAGDPSAVPVMPVILVLLILLVCVLLALHFVK